MRIRVETSCDIAAITEVLTLAFGQNNEARLVERIRRSSRYIPQLSLVAELNQQVVGHILFSQIDWINEQGSQAVLGLAPVAVHPDFQRQGIGSQLVKQGLQDVKLRPEAWVFVLGEPAFYSRFGFAPSSRWGIPSPFPVPDAYFMALPIHPMAGEDEMAGGQIVYPAAFDES